jgi:pimeloyl-ACP methyl ester carboxylesterase
MNSKTLIVAVRGWTNTGDRLLNGKPGGEFPPEAISALQEELGGATVWAPELDLPMFCMRHPESVAQELYAAIDNRLKSENSIESVVLLGYSAGSLLARRVFCIAHGAEEDGELTGCRAIWAPKIHRLVMLAGITRGWEFSTASPDHVRFASPVLQAFARTIGWIKSFTMTAESKTPFIWHLKRGAPFVISTRIQYVNVMEALKSQRSISAVEEQEQQTLLSPLKVDGLPTTVFLLGARDEFISPSDCTELGPRGEFAFIELGGSNHSEALLVAGESEANVARRERLAAALSSDVGHLCAQPWAVPAGDIDDYLDPMDLTENGAVQAMSSPLVEHAVMVVHGIRDNGFWTKRVAREIKKLARENQITVRAPSPSYGYFSMWDFVKPGGRQKATYWFMERYADVRSHFPSAKISFVGHSNGTYIAAHALDICKAIKFERIVFAGSVVRRDFSWDRVASRVRGVLNYVGNTDGVVAFLPAVFEGFHLRWLDVGGAGAFGLNDAGPPPAVRRKLGKNNQLELTEVRFVEGGHGAAIGEGFWPEIARFVLLDLVPERLPVSRKERTETWFRRAPAITVLGICIAALFLTMPLLVAVGIAIVMKTSLIGAVSIVAAISLGLVMSWLAGLFLRAW